MSSTPLFLCCSCKALRERGIVNQHPPVHHPLDACWVSFWHTRAGPTHKLVEFGNKYFIRSLEGTRLGTEWDNRLSVKESFLKWTKMLTCIFFRGSVCHLLYCFFVGLVLCLKWSQWTSTHQCTIQWMPVITQLWMNLNWVSIWFHLDNQFCNK